MRECYHLCGFNTFSLKRLSWKRQDHLVENIIDFIPILKTTSQDAFILVTTYILSHFSVITKFYDKIFDSTSWSTNIMAKAESPRKIILHTLLHTSSSLYINNHVQYSYQLSLYSLDSCHVFHIFFKVVYLLQCTAGHFHQHYERYTWCTSIAAE